jgi:hypothetical protein
MRTILAWSGILAAFELGAYGAEGAPGGGERFRAEARGIGSVEVAARTYGEGTTWSSWTTFKAEDVEHANVLGSKRLAGESAGVQQSVAEPRPRGSTTRRPRVFGGKRAAVGRRGVHG